MFGGSFISQVRSNPGKVFLLACLLTFSAYLRFGAVANSVVDVPVRADAKDYYMYALNMQEFGVYSRSVSGLTGSSTAPAPDALRSPGYPMLLYPFVDRMISSQSVRNIQLFQALLSTLTVAILFLAFSRLLPFGWAFASALLVGISPHLVNTTIYVLSETLFAFLLSLMFLVGSLAADQRRNAMVLLLAGVTVGLAALTRPVLMYFLPILIVLMAWHCRPGWKKVAGCLSLGFLVIVSPWMIRNYTVLGTTSDKTLTNNALHHGMYPDMMYEGDPRTYGMAYRADHFDTRGKEPSFVIEEIFKRASAEPAKYAYWYLIGKPMHLWRWLPRRNFVPAPVMMPAIYPTVESPFISNPIYIFLLVVMGAAHGFVMLGAVIAVIACFSPLMHRYFTPPQILGLRLAALLPLYNTAILAVAAPYTRYAIPFFPYVYVLFILSLYLMFRIYKQQQKQPEEGSS